MRVVELDSEGAGRVTLGAGVYFAVDWLLTFGAGLEVPGFERVTVD